MTGFQSKRMMAMSKMSELYTEIEEQLMNGAKPEAIAKAYDIPLKAVQDIEEDLIHLNDPQGYEYDEMD